MTGRTSAATPKGDAVAARILDAAVETLADRGYAGASMQLIADAAGVNKRMLLYYFGDRERLFASVTQHVGDRLLSDLEVAIADLSEPQDTIAVGFDLIWESVMSHPRLHAVYLGLVAASVSDDRLRPHVARVRERYDTLVRRQADQAVEAGYSLREEPRVLSALVIAGVQGLTLDYLQRGDSEQLRAAITAFKQWLAGLARRG